MRELAVRLLEARPTGETVAPAGQGLDTTAQTDLGLLPQQVPLRAAWLHSNWKRPSREDAIFGNRRRERSSGRYPKGMMMPILQAATSPWIRRIAPLLLLLSGGVFPASAQTRSAAPPAATPLEITFVDVGQGDATVIRTPNGRTIVIDAGPDPRTLAAWLQQRGVTTVALAVMSHNHADHIGGFPAVLAATRVENYLENGEPASTAIYRRVLSGVAAEQATVLRATPRTLTVDGVQLRILPMPPAGLRGADQNDRSVGILLTYGNFTALWTGDAEDAERQWWMQDATAAIGPVTVWKAAHHGSRNGTDAEWLGRIRPRLVVISLASDNTYGHPHASMLSTLQQAKLSPWRTDQRGDITVRTTGTGEPTVSATRPGTGLNPFTPGPPTRAGRRSRTP